MQAHIANSDMSLKDVMRQIAKNNLLFEQEIHHLQQESLHSVTKAATYLQSLRDLVDQFAKSVERGCESLLLTSHDTPNAHGDEVIHVDIEDDW